MNEIDELFGKRKIRKYVLHLLTRLMRLLKQLPKKTKEGDSVRVLLE